MALYISLSQLAVMVALPTEQDDTGNGLWVTVTLTSIGLIFAHQVAFRISARLVAKGSVLDPFTPRLLQYQLVGGFAVTILAAAPILLFGNGAYRWSMALLLLFVMAVGYVTARSAPTSRLRSIAYMLGVAGVVVAVLVVKNLVHH